MQVFGKNENTQKFPLSAEQVFSEGLRGFFRPNCFRKGATVQHSKWHNQQHTSLHFLALPGATNSAQILQSHER
jgi:hypothetical protein